MRYRFLLIFTLCALTVIPGKAQTFTVLHAFSGSADGEYPESTLLVSGGNLYGTTEVGGVGGVGTVFKIDSSGHETVIHSFTGDDGSNPFGSLIADSVGNVYGTTEYSGSAGSGLVFELDPVNGKETVIYRFTGSSDGAIPSSGLLRDLSGNLYGTTFAGGAGSCAPGCGTVFKIDPTGTETVLYRFTGGVDGYGPGGLVMDASGNLFGSTFLGKQAGGGAVFKIDSAGAFTVLHSSVGDTRGDLILGKHGLLYGTTMSQGTSDSGSIYAISPDGAETVLYSFVGGSDGYAPYSGVLQDKAGNLYGTTYDGGAGSGLVFKLDARTRAYSVIHTFNLQTDGGFPFGGLVHDSAGNIYGTTSQGGPTGLGTVFKLTP